MTLNKELFDKAIQRISELQNEIIEKADKVEGSKEYVKKQMQLFKEAEEHRKSLITLISKQEEISKEFIR